MDLKSAMFALVTKVTGTAENTNANTAAIQ
jgi:hypothetical protein